MKKKTLLNYTIHFVVALQDRLSYYHIEGKKEKSQYSVIFLIRF